MQFIYYQYLNILILSYQLLTNIYIIFFNFNFNSDDKKYNKEIK
jgi:hypothetical protein